MKKFYGPVGYAETVEETYDGKGTGVFKTTIVERYYFGDIVKRVSKWQNSGYVNDNLTIVEDISILADPYAISHFSNIKYVVYMGIPWKVTSVEVNYPRLILATGDKWNDNRPTATQTS